jgi:glycosyltransferase involved in cell wall biosynthesis
MVFASKVSVLRVRQTLRNLRDPVPFHFRGAAMPRTLAEIRAPLYEGREPEMELGKAQNLRRAAARLDGLRIPAGQTFSFWRQVGRCTRRRGFVRGREIRQGCVVPSVGGGICALTNGLYEAALSAGLDVVERHPHTRVLPGSSAERGMDATVAWNYLDLRLRAAFDWEIAVRLTRDELVVAIRAEAPVPKRLGQSKLVSLDLVGDCATCGQHGCFRHRDRPRLVRARTAYWVDEVWPEFAAYVGQRADGDLLLAPLDGERWRRPAYVWENADGHATVVALRHAWTGRRLADQGALRQQALIARSEAMVRRYAAMTLYDADEIVLPLSLLAFTWRKGVLGGRRFRVLANRLPLAEIHRRLDEAYSRFPERALLGDFRAPEELVEAEQAALREAESIVTPHREVAALFGKRAVCLPWEVRAMPWTPGPAIGFPGPVVGRKGAYEVREAARRLGLAVVTPGRDVEGEGFWGDVPVRRGSPLDGTFAVVLPAILEDRPRILLAAQAAGCPVVATRACGLDGVLEVESLNVEALMEAIRQAQRLGS